MSKKMSLFIIFFLFSFNLKAQEEEPKVEYIFNMLQQELYEDLGKSIPLAKSLPSELKDSESIQKVYFELKDSFNFNRAVMSYYWDNVENFQGYSSKSELIFHIPELTGIYNRLKASSNAVTKFRLEKQYKEKFEEFKNGFDMNVFKDKMYYSEVPLKGTFPYDFEKNEKTIIFSDYNAGFPSIYLTCFPNGEIIASFTSRQFVGKDTSIPSFVTKTPIILEVSEEIKEYVSYRQSKYGENLCANTKNFKTIEKGEIFESYSNNRNNTYMGFFTIDTTKTDRPYLIGKLSHIGYFIMDNDYYHMPFEIIGGQTFNETDLEGIPDRVFEQTIEKGNFSSSFLTSEFSYSFSDFFIKGKANNQLRLAKDKTNLHIIYDYEKFENEIVFTLNKIVKDSPDYYPLKFRITKEKNKEGVELTAFVLYSKSPFMYIKEELNLKNGFMLDWNSIIND